jgi:hypothetical protein
MICGEGGQVRGAGVAGVWAGDGLHDRSEDGDTGDVVAVSTDAHDLAGLREVDVPASVPHRKRLMIRR